MVLTDPEPSGLHNNEVIAPALFSVQVATAQNCEWAEIICEEMYRSALERGTGIAKRSPESIQQKMLAGEAVIAFTCDGRWAGFSYIASWDDGKFVSNSGLIVAPEYRKTGVASRIKQRVFELSRSKYPQAKIFSLTSGLAVMKMNTKLGFVPVTYSEIAQSDAFWKGCESCVNFSILNSKGRKNCLCTAMLFEHL